MTLNKPTSRLISAHNCIPFIYENIVMGEPLVLLDEPYEGLNVFMWQDGTPLHPYIQQGDYITLDGDRIYFTTGPTVLPYLINCDPTGANTGMQAQMALDLQAAFEILLPEYFFFITTQAVNEQYTVVAWHNNCGKQQRTFSGGFDINNDLLLTDNLRTDAFTGGTSFDRSATVKYEIMHNTDCIFSGTCITKDTGIIYAAPTECGCLNATNGVAHLDVAPFLRSKMFNRFPRITDTYQSEIFHVKPEMTRFFRVRGVVTTNNEYANNLQSVSSILTETLQAYNGLLQPNFVAKTGNTDFDIFTDKEFNGSPIHLPLNLNPNGLRTCANQLRFAQWWIFPQSAEYYIRIEIVPIVGGVPTVIEIDYLVDDFGLLGVKTCGYVFELNTGLPQLAAILAANGITDINTVDSISFGLELLDESFNVVYNNFYPVFYNIEKGCCCENQTQFIFLSSLGSWETIVLDANAGSQYEIASTDLDNCMCCTTPEPMQAWQRSTKTESRYLTEIYKATLHDKDYYDTPDLPFYYNGSDYIKEFLNSPQVYLVRPQALALGNITPTSDWLFYRAVISNELPDISDAIPTVISYRLYKNLSLQR